MRVFGMQGNVQHDRQAAMDMTAMAAEVVKFATNSACHCKLLVLHDFDCRCTANYPFTRGAAL